MQKRENKLVTGLVATSYGVAIGAILVFSPSLLFTFLGIGTLFGSLILLALLKRGQS